MLLLELHAVVRFYYADDLLLTFLREKKKKRNYMIDCDFYESCRLFVRLKSDLCNILNINRLDFVLSIVCLITSSIRSDWWLFDRYTLFSSSVILTEKLLSLQHSAAVLPIALLWRCLRDTTSNLRVA